MMCFNIFILLMLGASITCEPQDLSGKMFTFPKEDQLSSSPALVKIDSKNLELGAASVCLRFFTDMTKEYMLFSLGKLSTNFPLIPNLPNPPEDVFHFVANKPNPGDFKVFVGGAAVNFHGHNVKLNTWQSACVTWDAGTGLTQLWLNGNPSSRKFTSKSHLNGAYTVTLGKVTSVPFGLGLILRHSFVGMMSDLQMWDFVLTPQQIQGFNLNTGSYPSGNLFSWANLDFEVTGPVIIEDEFNI